MTKISETWKMITDFQEAFYPNWKTEKPKLLFVTGLAGEVGEVCGVATHLEGGGTNQRKYDEKHLLHQCVDAYVQLVLLLARYGFSSSDFESEFQYVLKVELQNRLKAKRGVEYFERT